ncbi:MAG TPA: hypothetical protein PLC17_04590 [Tenuifilaceae bacterium]|mgnify:CR=1 FL=1|nr:hypothetical protein [Tenuifilaceae bacterium]HQB77235.1 hypothetical protein [Tenuifilaceae bacterium]
MKKLLLIAAVTMGVSFGSAAQNSLGKTDDLGRVALAAVVPDQAEGIPQSARAMLQNKMQQIAVQNGLGATGVNSRFFIVPLVNVVSRDITPTAPPMHSLNVDVTFYIVDAVGQLIFSQTTISAKGVGQSEDKAYMQALKNINVKSGQFRGFIEQGKEKIIEFYNSQCDVVLKGAQTLAGQKKYEEAMFILLSVPDVCRECFDKSLSLSVDIYKEYADYKCGELLAAAKAAYASMDIPKVEENVSKITPDMACYGEAAALVEEIKQKQLADGANVWEFKMKVYDDSVEKEKLIINSAKDVAVAWAYWGAAPYFNWNWDWLYKK